MNFIDMNDDDLERYMDLMIASLEEALVVFKAEPEVLLVSADTFVEE